MQPRRSHLALKRAGSGLVFVMALLWCACRNESPQQSQFSKVTSVIAQQQYARAEELVQRNPELLRQSDPSKRTVLFMTVAQRNVPPEFIRKLLSLKADVNSTTDLGFTPLMIASERGDTAVIQLLLGAGADPNRRDNAGRSALNRAVQFSRTDAIKLLMDNDAIPDIFDAAALGFADRVEEMVRRDPTLATKRGDHGFTALQVAAFRQQSGVVKVLLPLQNELDLCTAAAVGDLDALRKTLTQKVSPNKPAGNGLPPLVCAVMARQTKSAEVLLNFGAHVGGGPEEGIGSPLVTAIRKGDKEMVALLLNHGADKHEVIPGFGTPYTIALAAKQSEIAELLK